MSERGSISVTWTPCLGRWFRDLYWRPLDLLRSSLLRSPRRRQNPCEWTPRLGSAKPIAQRRPKGDLDAVPASWTIGSEGDGCAHPGGAAVGATWITVLRLAPTSRSSSNASATAASAPPRSTCTPSPTPTKPPSTPSPRCGTEHLLCDLRRCRITRC